MLLKKDYKKTTGIVSTEVSLLQMISGLILIREFQELWNADLTANKEEKVKKALLYVIN